MAGPIREKTMDDHPPRMTRHQILQHLQGLGFPITLHALNKACQRNDGPQPIAWWGRRPLYDPALAVAWAEGRLRLTSASEAA